MTQLEEELRLIVGRLMINKTILMVIKSKVHNNGNGENWLTVRIKLFTFGS